MPPLFTLRGYDRPDPLDRLATRPRYLLHIAVTTLVLTPWLYFVFFVLEAATLSHDALWLLELGLLSTIYAALFVTLRKSSSLVQVALLVIPGMVLDLFIESHFRHLCGADSGTLLVPAIDCVVPWKYNQDLLGFGSVQLTFLVTWLADAIVAGPVALWLSRLVASGLLRRAAPTTVPDPSPAEHAALFRAPWIADDVPKPERGWVFYGFMAIGLAYFAYLAFITVALVGIAAWGGGAGDMLEQTFANPAMAINTFIKVSIMATLLLAAAYNAALRWHASLVLIIGHAVSVAASLGLYAMAPAEPPLGVQDYSDFLLMSVAIDGLFVAFFAFAMGTGRKDGRLFARDASFPSFHSVPQRIAKWTLYTFALLFAGGFVLVLLSRFSPESSHGYGAVYGFPDPQVSNSLTKYATLAALAFLLAEREALRHRLLGILSLAAFVGVLTGLGFHILGDAFGDLAVKVRLDPVVTRFFIEARGPMELAPVPPFGCLASVEVLLQVLRYFPVPALAVHVDWYFTLTAALNGLGLVILFSLHRYFWNVDYTITALTPSGARGVMALHDAFYGPDPSRGAPLPPAPEPPTVRADVELDPVRVADAADDSGAVLTALDRHLGEIRGRKRGLMNAPFAAIEHALPLFYGLRPPLSVMSHAERRHFLRRYVLRPPAERARAQVPEVAELGYILASGLHALVTLAHYDRRAAWPSTGYLPPDARARLQSDHASGPPAVPAVAAPLPTGPHDPANWRPDSPTPAAPRVAPRVVTPIADLPVPAEVDYLIVGSGAGGATAAYRLACAVADPSRVLVVERGPRLSPLQDMADSELEMIRRFYKEGGIQQTKRLDMMIMQGECVGGTTVINNGVCYRLQDVVRSTWDADYGLGGLDLDGAYARVADELGIAPLPASAVHPGLEGLFRQAVAGYNARSDRAQEQLSEVRVVEANFLAPHGTGLGAFGNKRLRKRSMLETYLPWAEARGVQVLSDTSAVRFHVDPKDPRRATSVTLRSVTGQTRRVNVKQGVIVAAGAVASSHFLMRSDVGGYVGQQLHCNFALPLTAEYAEPLDAFEGAQIAFGAEDPRGHAVFETFANPPGTCALELPFYFGRHAAPMHRYRHLVNLAALVGSEPLGEVSLKADLLHGRAVHWHLGPQDRGRIGYALSTLVDLAAASGAKRVYLSSQPGLAADVGADSTALSAALRNFPFRMRDFRMFTSHPSGGNIMAAAGSVRGSEAVVDEHFLVRGFDNVFVADASIFPTATVVNPQWTVMALASLAAESVLARAR